MNTLIRSARTFQSEVLTGVMKSPMSFFDTTPSGRIVNRFGKDLDAVDMTIPGSIRQWISCILRVIGTLYILGLVFTTHQIHNAVWYESYDMTHTLFRFWIVEFTAIQISLRCSSTKKLKCLFLFSHFKRNRNYVE